MIRKALLLGFFSIGGQVLLLRELISSLNGDELFIGTAFCGWLAAVAVGALIGGNKRWCPPVSVLFVIGAVVLPLMVTASRLSPLLVTELVGEAVPFGTAALLSWLVMLPLGLVSGWLFPAIAREGRTAVTTVAAVYMYEGIGAFVGGVLITVASGGIFSTMEMACVLCGVVVAGGFVAGQKRRLPVLLAGGGCLLLLSLVLQGSVARLDHYLDQVKYGSFKVVESFDTHYAHQAILLREGSLVLLTDNTVEGTLPDRETAENLLIPPLLYQPEARSILYVGRPELGVLQLAEASGDLTITVLDPRRALTERLADHIAGVANGRWIHDDPVRYFARRDNRDRYDIIIIDIGEPGSYRSSRLLTSAFFDLVRARLTPAGVVHIPTRYDTDRYVTDEVRAGLTAIHTALAGSFDRVTMWPGQMTLLMASPSATMVLPYDSLLSRLNRLSRAPHFISDDYLYDRLDDFRVQRLVAAVSRGNEVNSLDRPVLPHLHALYRARANTFDRKIVAGILNRPVLAVGIPVIIVLAMALAGLIGRRGKGPALFLYFTAGLVSLALELVSFYVYQSLAGSLYSEIAVLIGAFMLGLAAGTFIAGRSRIRRPEYPALTIMLVSILIFWFTYDRIAISVALWYHSGFLLVVAAATGGLFVAATNRYYGAGKDANQGAGYACELAGSSLAGLVTATILLPIIGLTNLLPGLAAIVALALIGSVITARNA